MGYVIGKGEANQILEELEKNFDIYAPRVFEGEGCFSDTDSIRYGMVHNIDEIMWEKKSEYSFKEVFIPVSETLFYFTEDTVQESKNPVKSRIIFLRSCDLHAVKRLDEVYLNNGFEDAYYKRLRENTKFILMGCTEGFENCFCVSMGTNKNDTYDAYLKVEGDEVYIDSQWDELSFLAEAKSDREEVREVDFVKKNQVKVIVNENLNQNVMKSEIWKEYAGRCIACGRCNFACPTCTCFTMQDIFYQDNPKAGERRRIHASCQVDGFTDMAGGHSFRADKGQRMRFKVMHKVYDYKKRFGYHMCVGCGRCDDICPEYISFSGCVNRLGEAMKEVGE